jgi:hypothetical protein
MSKTRFDGFIHSIVGHQIMVSQTGHPGEQFKCALDDFESIIPTTNAGQPFSFHVKRSMIGVEHYRNWLGLAKMDNDRLGNIERGLLDLINLVRPASKPTTEPEFAEFFKDVPEAGVDSLRK